MKNFNAHYGIAFNPDHDLAFLNNYKAECIIGRIRSEEKIEVSDPVTINGRFSM